MYVCMASSVLLMLLCVFCSVISLVYLKINSGIFVFLLVHICLEER